MRLGLGPWGNDAASEVIPCVPGPTNSCVTIIINNILVYLNKRVEGIAGDEHSIKEELEPSEEVGSSPEPTKEVQLRRN